MNTQNANMTKTFFFLSMVLCRASGMFLTRGEKQEVLSYHNELRRGEGASNMKEMVNVILYSKQYRDCSPNVKLISFQASAYAHIFFVIRNGIIVWH